MNDKAALEAGSVLSPNFNAYGLITAVVSEASTGEPLMVAHMNAAALDLSIETGEAHFYSRSRGEIWHKGATSGNVLTIRQMRIDCDQDAVWLSVEIAGHGAACHTGRKSCFYRKVVRDQGGRAVLDSVEENRLFSPEIVYKK